MGQAISAYYQDIDFTQSLKIDIESVSALTRLVSPTHDIKVFFGNNYKTAEVALSDPGSFYENSFTVLFRNQLLNQPIVLTERVKGREHAMILSFMADLRDKDEIEQI
jgi:hypothetical protein